MNFKNTTHSKMKDLVAKKYGKKSCYSCQKSYSYSPKRAIEKLKEIELQEARSYKKPIRYYKSSKCISYHLQAFSKMCLLSCSKRGLYIETDVFKV